MIQNSRARFFKAIISLVPKMSRFSLVVLLSLLANVANAAYCNGKPDDGERVSQFPIYDGELKFVRSIKNAMLFQAGPPNATFDVVHLWGNPYEIGFAQGTLMKKEVVEFVTKTWAYLVEEIADSMGDKMPKAARELIASKGMSRALDWTAEVTSNFTSQAFYDEVRGLADATGLDYDLLYRVQMFPELTKAQCSFFGAWGDAVAKEGHSYQLRALDFDTTGPFKDYPQLTVYHPTDQGHAYAQVSWPGNVGSLSGFSEHQIAISEIGVSYPDESFEQGVDGYPPEKVYGEPWMFILRDVLQFSTSLEEAEERIATSNRTCNLILGVGDGEENKVHGVQFSGYVANFYDDQSLLPVNETWHPVIKDIVYNGMDWLCPNFDSALYEQFTKFYGTLSEENVINDILPTVQTGDLHAVVYDLTESTMHVSFCRRASADPSEPEFAYERQFTRLHMKDIFAQQPPTDV